MKKKTGKKKNETGKENRRKGSKKENKEKIMKEAGERIERNKGQKESK